MTEKERKELKAGDKVIIEIGGYNYHPAEILEVSSASYSSPLNDNPMFLVRYKRWGFSRQAWIKAYYVMAKRGAA